MNIILLHRKSGLPVRQTANIFFNVFLTGMYQIMSLSYDCLVLFFQFQDGVKVGQFCIVHVASVGNGQIWDGSDGEE